MARNVLLIVADQWRGDCLKQTGHPLLDLPNLERLSAMGTTFRRHYVQCVPCGPARCTLHTGTYLMNHRAVRNSTPLNSDWSNLALEVRKGGHEPALVGYTTTTPDPRKVHPNDPRFRVMGDLMEGWREVTSFSPGKAPFVANMIHAGSGDLIPDERFWWPKEGPNGPTVAPSRLAKDLTDTAWLTECGLRYLMGRQGAPFFLHLGFYRPHPPFIAAEPYNGLFDPADVPAPRWAASLAAEGKQHPLLGYYLQTNPNHMYFHGAEGLAAELDEPAVRLMRAAYLGMIKEIDDHLGRVFDWLDTSGQWDDTLVIFTSDHGEQLGDHHLCGKLGYFDESFHIPLIVSDPKARAHGGRMVDAFSEQVDVMPTILDWLGLDVPRQCDGYSLLPWCHGETPADWRREVHYELDFREVASELPQQALGLEIDDCCLAVIQDEAYKYVHFAGLPPLFFDLNRDPHQFTNLAADPAYQGPMLAYAQKMLSWRLRYNDRRFTGMAASPEGLIERRR